MSIEEYKKLYKEDWDIKEETLQYLRLDLDCLYEIIKAANNQIFQDYKVNMKDSLTISGLAMKIYLTKYYKNNIPRINKPSLYQDIKESYYGGMTEVSVKIYIIMM